VSVSDNCDQNVRLRQKRQVTPTGINDRKIPMTMILAIDSLLSFLTLFSGPYRVVAYKLRSFGGIRRGCVTWIGIALVFPACIVTSTYGDLWWIAWVALVVWAYIQMVAKWCSTSPELDATSPHCWIGRGEPVFAVVLAIVTGMVCGPGGGAFVVTGYACSTIDWLLRRLRLRVETWTPSDTARLLAPARNTVIWLTIAAGNAVAWLTATACIAAARVRPALPMYSSVIRHYGLAIASVTATTLGYVWLFLVKRAQRPPTAPSEHYRRWPSFSSRVTSFVVGHLVFSVITGTLGFWGIMKGIGMILAIPAAILLWMVGGKPDLPEFAKEDARGAITRVKEALADKKDELEERWQEKKEALRERWDDKKEEISEGVSRTSKRAAWKYFTR
jgi:hypothetical protein